MSDRPKRGFACGDNAAKAGRKAHAMGVAHQWSSEDARRLGRQNASEQPRDDRGRLLPKPDPRQLSV